VNHDPIVKRAFDSAAAIVGEAGHITGVILICEIEGDGLIVAFDDERLPVGPLSDVLRKAADRIDPTV
jgi:hypothetical protein